MLTPDGQLVVTPEGGTRGASVLTANGVVYLDRTDPLPVPVVHKSAYERWVAPTGFLLPADGIWRETSVPATLVGPGLRVTLRASDALVPAWGGEILLRLDVSAPAEERASHATRPRAPTRLVLVMDAGGDNAADLARALLTGVGEADRVAVVDAAHARTVLPLVPGAHRTLLGAAAARVARSERGDDAADVGPPPPPGGLAAALGEASDLLASAPRRPGAAASAEVVVVSDGVPFEAHDAVRRAVDALETRGARVSAVGARDDLPMDALAPLGPRSLAGVPYRERVGWAARAVPPPGAEVVRHLTLSLASSPAPARILEPSGGTSTMRLDSDELALGALHVGESRTEVLRVSVPVWVPGEPLELRVTARYEGPGREGEIVASEALHLEYSEDIAALANRRHGDVIAYASALAMVRRLDRAFIRHTGSGAADASGVDADLREIVSWQATSLTRLASERGDGAMAQQAEVLHTLLAAFGPEI
jgi:hypothetical protein